MSWAEENQIDGWEPPDPSDERDIRDKDVWVDGTGIECEWDDLETEHIRRIIVGLRNGKGDKWWGQGHKLERAEKEYAERSYKSEQFSSERTASSKLAHKEVDKDK